MPGEVVEEKKGETGGKSACDRSDRYARGKCSTGAVGPGAQMRTWRGVWRYTDWFAPCVSGGGTCSACVEAEGDEFQVGGGELCGGIRLCDVVDP